METTPKNFALQIGAFITLFTSISGLIMLMFGLINIAYPDAAEGYWGYESAQSSVRYAIALLVVFFPAYVFLTRKVNVARRTETNFYHTLTRWVLHLALLIGGLVLLGDLVAVILTFLNGELTTRFILKALTILVVVGSAMYYYWQDSKGYWKDNERQSIYIGAFTALLVASAIVYGYTLIDSPKEVRDSRLDQQQLTDLQDMQWRIEAHYVDKKALPKDLSEVYTDLPAPSAPEDRVPYSYKPTGDKTYELCATFAKETPEVERMMSKPMYDPAINPNNYNWEHPEGAKCFEREVTPSNTQILEKEVPIN
jgi:hypothetical protein